MKIIYIVNNGQDYDDYGISAVFLKKQDAEKYVKNHGGEREEWEEYTAQQKRVKSYHDAGYRMYMGKVFEDGVRHINIVDACNESITAFDYGKPGYQVYAWAKSEADFIKLAQERVKEL